ncbi:hypothetical protein PDESU_02504 [Pontiella desulfatans]|uniref:Uncharacterized protein n=1 Tax=Pontiella desulfatans TaxID=2750659 RepID=A0A6C2U239_PONDE|nr:hypothetical protein [Pontiella desulfatans]VGO13947.1 hypothetical protein PDESU_02504 [Pontiella desulfatans]
MMRWNSSKLLCVAMVVGAGFLTQATEAVSPPADHRNYAFLDGEISQEVLENYLSRAITIAECLHSNGLYNSGMPYEDSDDDLRMILNTGAKFVGRSIFQWDKPALFNEPGWLAAAKTKMEAVHQEDPTVIFQAAIFESVTDKVNVVPIPDWVFEEFGMSVEQRNFNYEAMLNLNGNYVAGTPGWDKGFSVPDITRLETQLFFYFMARQYIDIGIEAIHWGQMSLMAMGDHNNDYTAWQTVLGKVRAYARDHARRGTVLCDAHMSNYGLKTADGHFLCDFSSFPLRVKEDLANEGGGLLEVGHISSIYGKTPGGITPSGWSCKRIPYLVEFDNFGGVLNPGVPDLNSHWVWGYDEISWFGSLDEARRNEFLRYAFSWLKKHDNMGYLEMPGNRRHKLTVEGSWSRFRANLKQHCSTGTDLEVVIKELWSAGTVGFWRFETGAVTNDSSGNGLNLTQRIAGASGGGSGYPEGVARNESGAGSFLSTIPQTVAANTGVSYFNAKGNHWAVADTNLFDFGGGGFTFETFVTPSDQGFQQVAIKDEEWKVSIHSANGLLTVSLWDSATNDWVDAKNTFDGNTTFATGKDFYIAAVVDPGDTDTALTLYYRNLTDGGDLLSVDTTIAGLNSINNTTNDFLLNGSQNFQAVDYMDEVRLSYGALSRSELLATVPELGYWRFEPGVATHDSSGNRLDLTQRIAGAPTGGADYPKGVARPSTGDGVYLPTIPQSGVTNAGVSFFNARGNHWAVGDTNLFDFGANAFSFEAFVTPTAGNGFQIVASKAEEWRVTLHEGTGDLIFGIWDTAISNWATAQAKLDGTNSFAGSVDYYIGAVVTPGVSNTAVTLYYQNLTDGGDLLSAEKTIAGVNSIQNTTNSFLLNGSANNKAVRYLDEVRLSAGALSRSELLVASIAVADPGGFDAFVDQYDLSGDPSANADNDELTDWGEYVFGGNPTNSGDIGTQPSFDSGDYLFSIVGDSALQYYVLTTTNLVEGSWGTNTGPVAITDESGELGSYSNTVGTADDQLFIKLLVE